MKNVTKAAEEVKSRIGDAPINFLVLSQGIMNWDGFTPTEEGIDRKLALHFYSRWKVRHLVEALRQLPNNPTQFVDELLSKLEKANQAGQESRVMSVFSPGSGGALDVDDLGLKKSFSTYRAATQAPTYNDIMTDVSASKNPARCKYSPGVLGILQTAPFAQLHPYHSWRCGYASGQRRTRLFENVYATDPAFHYIQ